MAEQLGNRATTQKVAGSILACKWHCVLGQGTSPCTYCKSLWIRASAKCKCNVLLDLGFYDMIILLFLEPCLYQCTISLSVYKQARSLQSKLNICLYIVGVQIAIWCFPKGAIHCNAPLWEPAIQSLLHPSAQRAETAPTELWPSQEKPYCMQLMVTLDMFEWPNILEIRLLIECIIFVYTVCVY